MASCHTDSKTIFLLALVGIDYLSDLADSLHHPHSQNLEARLEVVITERLD